MKSIPASHNQVMPYLILENAADFSRFTKELFNADAGIEHLREDGKTVMHGEIRIGESTIMYSQATHQYKPQTANLFIYVTDADQSYNKALTLGATSITEPANQEYGRSCGIKDPFGNTWWITSL
jgi:PhnB protein